MIIDKMLRCTAKVCKYCQDLSYDEFCGSEMLIEACVFNLSQIGELTDYKIKGRMQSGKSSSGMGANLRPAKSYCP